MVVNALEWVRQILRGLPDWGARLGHWGSRGKQCAGALAAFLLPLLLWPLFGGRAEVMQWQRIDSWPGDHVVEQVISRAVGGSQRLYAVGAVSGLFVSDDGGESWASASMDLPKNPLGVVRIEALAVHPQDPDEMHVAVASLSSTPRPMVYWTEDGGATWRVRSSLGPKRIAGIAFEPGGDQLYMVSVAELFASYSNADDSGTRHFVRDNADIAANTLSTLDPRIEVTDVVVAPVAGAADDALAFYLGTVHDGLLVLHKSADDSTEWVPPAADEASTHVRTEATVHVICPHPLTPNVVCVGTESGVYVSADAGRSWRPMAYALSEERIRSLIIAADGRTMYAGLDRAVQYSEDGGVHWAELGKGLGNTQVMSLSLSADEHTLYAGTNEGLWQIALRDGMQR